MVHRLSWEAIMRNELFMYLLYSEIHRDPGWSLSTAKIFLPPPPLQPPVVYAIDRSKAVVPLCSYSVWLCGLYYGALHVLKSSRALRPRVSSFLLALWSSRLGRRELVCVLLVHLFVLYVLVFVIFLFLLVSRVGCGLWLWHSLDFPINFLMTFSAFGRENAFCGSSVCYLAWTREIFSLNQSFCREQTRRGPH